MAGTKRLFKDGKPTIEQEIVAIMLALGKGQKEIGEMRGVDPSSIWRWLQIPAFKELVEKYRKEVIERVKTEGFDGMDFLKRTQIESLLSNPSRADGLRAREIEARILGEIAGQSESKVKDKLKNLSDKQLAVLKQAGKAANGGNTI